MGNGIIAVLVALGASAWIFNKVQKTSGNNTQSSLIVAAVSAIAIFVLIFMLLGLVPKS